jgi:hypothetical protein
MVMLEDNLSNLGGICPYVSMFSSSSVQRAPQLGMSRYEVLNGRKTSTARPLGAKILEGTVSPSSIPMPIELAGSLNVSADFQAIICRT